MSPALMLRLSAVVNTLRHSIITNGNRKNAASAIATIHVTIAIIIFFFLSGGFAATFNAISIVPLVINVFVKAEQRRRK